MKPLLKATAIVEALTGVALVGAPSFLVSVLLGLPLEGSAALIVARITGLALLALAIACWQSGNNIHAPAIVQAMLFYNTSIAVFLLYCILFLKLSVMGLLPVCILHTLLAVWCVRELRAITKKQ